MASITSGTLEDLLVMTIGGLAAYVSVINLPLRCAGRGVQNLMDGIH